MWAPKRHADARTQRRLIATCTALLTVAASVCDGHQSGPLGEEVLDWRTEQISRAVATWVPAPSVMTVDGKRCITAGVIYFDVSDELAFDLDEDIALHVNVLLEGTGSSIAVTYERNGFGQTTETVEIPGGVERRSSSVDITLERARFANNDRFRSDFSLGLKSSGPLKAICGVSFARSFKTTQATRHGNLVLHVKDERDLTTPALIGLYDEHDRMPLPSSQAIPFRKFTYTTRQVDFGDPRFGGNRLWPVANRSAFYINGRYEARLPVGQYVLIVAKGPEYRVTTRPVTIGAQATAIVNLKLVRWIDMRAKGWYSGDGHIHYTRENDTDDKNLLLVAQAEDLQVANTLQMGNVGKAYYPQHRWEPVIAADNSPFALVAGQEDPRTGHRGHTLHLNLKQPVRIPQQYLLYHEVFERTRGQGGTVGYAHVRDEDALDSFDVGARKGMALDVPFGLVDFVEVLEFGSVSTRTWFDYLNLGYKLSAAAGTDFPYHNQFPGADRNYVYLGKRFEVGAWFDALKQGRTFVTNGPMLEVSANNQSLGHELRLSPGGALTFDATASINPDIDLLDRLELIEQGEIVKTVSSTEGAERLHLTVDMHPRHSTWFVIRARGKGGKNHGNTAAISSPIYVHVDDQSFWKPAAVPEIVARVKNDLAQVMVFKPFEYEAWDATETQNMQLWAAQKDALGERVRKASAIYDELAERAKQVTRAERGR